MCSAIPILFPFWANSYAVHCEFAPGVRSRRRHVHDSTIPSRLAAAFGLKNLWLHCKAHTCAQPLSLCDGDTDLESLYLLLLLLLLQFLLSQLCLHLGEFALLLLHHGPQLSHAVVILQITCKVTYTVGQSQGSCWSRRRTQTLRPLMARLLFRNVNCSF